METFSTVKGNLAAEPEVLITLLLLQTERRSKAEMGVTTQAAYMISRHRATPSAEYPRWRSTAGSGDNLAIFSNTVVTPNPKQVDTPSHTHTV